MRECSSCEKEGKHRWGRYWLCDEHHKKALKTHQSKDKDPTINIPEKTLYYEGGWYTQGGGEIYLLGTHPNISIEVVLNHEFIHHILNVFISPPTSYDYDNVALLIDIYHG